MPPEYVQQAIHMAPYAATAIGQIGGPIGFVGRIAGLGPEELDAGIPGWAWLLMGLGGGMVAGYLSRPYLEKHL